MFFLDSELTITERGSSLIRSHANVVASEDLLTVPLTTPKEQTRSVSAQRVTSFDSSFTKKPRSVERELVTVLFESMLEYIIESWNVIENKVTDPVNTLPSILEFTDRAVKRKKTICSDRSAKGKVALQLPVATTPVSWWNGPDELVRITFINGNTYEGNISMKCMHGLGKFQWTSGTSYLIRGGILYHSNIHELLPLIVIRGALNLKRFQSLTRWQLFISHYFLHPLDIQSAENYVRDILKLLGEILSDFSSGNFCYNEMQGPGRIEWKDQSWYEGGFENNLRHGRGIFVNSIDELCYIGTWHNATKHGNGIIYYSQSNLYDGCWKNNVPHGFGAREYCGVSGYKGNWDLCIRNGRGIMIWPNHDYYNGEWKDGVMDGQGTYIWSTHANGTMSVSSQISYKGCWKNGMRHGHGIARFGYANGSHYKGHFSENKKHGKGSLVTGDGNILQSTQLFRDDNLTSGELENIESSSNTTTATGLEPRHLEMCAEDVDVLFHIDQAIRKIGPHNKLFDKIIDQYTAANKKHGKNMPNFSKQTNLLPLKRTANNHFNMKLECEELQKAVQCFETELKNIYLDYAILCNPCEIAFNPILIRLFLWQMYCDCKIQRKGLTLVQIDNMLFQNPAWLIESRHDPFEKIYYWQFVHSVITVANKLYYTSTGQCSVALRQFIMEDLIPNSHNNKGIPRKVCMEDIPLKSIHILYRSIGEPHTIRDFLQAIRHGLNFPPHLRNVRQPSSYETPDEILSGKNIFNVEDQPTYVFDKLLYKKEPDLIPVETEPKLFILGLLPSKTIINNFEKIFPQLIYYNDNILNLEIEMTFLEFYEVFLANAEDVMALKEDMDREREAATVLL